MKRSIFYVVVLAILFVLMIITTSHADGLRGEAYDTFLPSHIQSTPPVQTASYGGGTNNYGYGYGYGYDPYGPPLYSPWNSSRCKDCSGVWNGYGCHEFKQGGQQGNCGGGGHCGKVHQHGCRQGGCNGSASCTQGGCAESPGVVPAAPVEVAPESPPTPTGDQSASRGFTLPLASGLFPVTNH
ncbi:MAG TPA: hypothetical protein VMX74_13325 [Pirellulales bacterium]|nr:hypothetical protein [Pirellulales bacterium]